MDTAGRTVPGSEPYERLGELYDRWCESVDEDVPFYREHCQGADGPIVELGCGSGRIAVPLALDGHEVVGLDGSPQMLEQCRTRARAAGVEDRITLVLGDLRDPPPLGPAARVIVPFRPYLHLSGDDERVRALRAAAGLLADSGSLAFDVFEPSLGDVRHTDDRWIERENGIWERARWDWVGRTVELSVRSRGRIVTMQLEWRSAADWRALCERAGLQVAAVFAGFNGDPSNGWPGDHVFVCRRAP